MITGGDDLMGREWKIGDPVDGTTDGWMDAQNWGHGYDDEEDDDENPINQNDTQRRLYSKKAWELYMDYKEEEALEYINLALDLDNMNPNDWNRKAIILESLKRYEESERCYDESLRISSNNTVKDNKIRMLYSWAYQMFEESKKLPDGSAKLEKAMQLCTKAIASHPWKNSKEKIERYFKLKESIEFYINYEKTYQKNLKTVKRYPKEELITVTGRNFYKTNIDLTPGMTLRLVREPDNEFDSDAIAVYAWDEKIGYVANRDYTKFELTSKASDVKDRISNECKAEYICYLDRYAEIQFNIARLL